MTEFKYLNETFNDTSITLEALEEKNRAKYGDGFLSNAISYATYAPSNFLAPALVQLLPHKIILVSFDTFCVLTDRLHVPFYRFG